MPDQSATEPSASADALSRFVELAGLTPRLDLRCQFAGGYAVDHGPAAAGEIVFHLVLAGRCVVERDGAEAVGLEAGDFLALPRGAAHRLRSEPAPTGALAPFELSSGGLLPLRRNAAGAAGLDLLCGRLSASRAAEALLATLPGALHARLADARPAAELGAIVALIRAEVEAAQPGALSIVAALVRVLFTLALRAQTGRAGPGLLALLGDARLAAAAQALLAEPGRDWDMVQLAALATMSRATFMRHFVERAGTTPGDFLTTLRVARAAELLRRTRRSTGDIGMEVGYRSESAFNKAFARTLGVSPAAYRRAS